MYHGGGGGGGGGAGGNFQSILICLILAIMSGHLAMMSRRNLERAHDIFTLAKNELASGKAYREEEGISEISFNEMHVGSILGWIIDYILKGACLGLTTRVVKRDFFPSLETMSEAKRQKISQEWIEEEEDLEKWMDEACALFPRAFPLGGRDLESADFNDYRWQLMLIHCTFVDDFDLSHPRTEEQIKLLASPTEYFLDFDDVLHHQRL